MKKQSTKKKEYLSYEKFKKDYYSEQEKADSKDKEPQERAIELARLSLDKFRSIVAQR